MNCLTSKRKNQQGFTLLELAIVMVTAGFLMMGALALYRVYLVQKNIDLTYEKIDTLKASISIFSDSTGRYPCPSDPSLPYTDPMFGVENCAAAAALAEGTCTGPGNTGICRVPGRVIDVSGVAEAVYIGAVPFRTIKSGVEKVECINPATRAPTDCSAPGAVELVTNDASFQLSSLDSALDPWGYQVTYAVTASLTSAVSFNNGRGAISVRTEHGDSLVDPDGIAGR